MTHKLATVGLALAMMVAAPFAGSALAFDEKEFKVVGTWGNVFAWQEFEERFWTEDLPKASGGKLTANAKPYTELGLSGFEVVRLLKLGAYDAAHAVTTYAAQDAPELEGVDLAGVFQDFPTYRKAINAYRPVIEKVLASKYNAKLLMMYSFPSQQLWCNLKPGSGASLNDLKGKKIRTYSTTLGDFIEGLGASAVTIAFAEAVPALQRGVVDCGITGTTPAYNAKWWQVANTNIRIRLGYAATFGAMNMKVWQELSKESQDIVMTAAQKLEDEMWTRTAELDVLGMNCNASGPCPMGEPGGMKPVEPSDADKAQLKDIVSNFVLNRFAKRCGKACIETWNATVGKVAGLQAPIE
jgi:TRAP-type C4-dicarboxylate transport system substrate-binding protein